MTTLNQVHSETFSRDGIEYEIRIVDARGGLVGEWTCSLCGATGESSIIEEELLMAVRTTQRSLGTHHFFKHQHPRDKVA